ncbi:MAG: ArsR family transcriptional regulator [Candidatus Altiarchaeota archaeon]
MRIRIIRHKKPADHELEQDLDWLCSSLGFCEDIDKDRTAAAIFRSLLESTYEGRPLRSDDIAERVGKSRGAVVNHLNKLMSSGLVVRHGTRYELREQSLQNTLLEMRRDMERMMQDMQQMAEEIDKEFATRRRPPRA